MSGTRVGTSPDLVLSNRLRKKVISLPKFQTRSNSLCVKAKLSLKCFRRLMLQDTLISPLTDFIYMPMNVAVSTVGGLHHLKVQRIYFHHNLS